MTEPPSELKLHSTLIWDLVYSFMRGAWATLGLDAIVKVFLIEKMPGPASVTALILYWTS